MKSLQVYEPRHEISSNVVCATSKGSDQPAHTCSLIRAFPIRLNILTLRLLTEHNLEFLSLKEASLACLILHLSKCNIVGNLMSRLIFWSRVVSWEAIFPSCYRSIMKKQINFLWYVGQHRTSFSYLSYLGTKA